MTTLHSANASEAHALAKTRNVAAHQDETRRLVSAMMTLTGLTASGLARAAGLTPSTLNRFMHKDVGHTLSQRTLLALLTRTLLAIRGRPLALLDPAALSLLAPALSVYEPGILAIAPEAHAPLAEIKAGLSPSSALADLPVVMATSRGIDVASAAFAAAPLRTARPPFLKDDPLGFALLMPDASMSPRYDAGDMLYVGPAQAVENGGDVVLVRTDGFSVGTLVGNIASAVRVAILNPKSKVAFERTKLKGVYPIIGLQRMRLA